MRERNAKALHLTAIRVRASSTLDQNLSRIQIKRVTEQRNKHFFIYLFIF